MLNKLRSRVERFLHNVVKPLSKTHVTPNALTATSLVVAILGYALVVYTGLGTLLAMAIMLSGFIDAIDGAMARLTGKVSRKGAFLDSVVDRVSEAVFALAFVELGFNSHIVLIYLASSMIVSYMRAKGESLGLSLSGVGLMERAERLIALTVVAILADVNHVVAFALYIAFTAMVVYTAARRFAYAWKTL
ncbi:MAG: archaetidylinositol phosphate synthase [Desulfurococcaceae archaeon]